MEETTIVIMLKDEETGFLDQELGSYSVPERAELIWSIYVKSNEVVLRLSCDRELEDWEYEAVFDYLRYRTCRRSGGYHHRGGGPLRPCLDCRVPFY